MVAYACGPKSTGEHWLGWGWAREAARFGHIHLITTPKYRDSVSAHARELDMTCDFIAPAGPEGWGRKLFWQKHVFLRAKKLHAENPFQLVHQTTFHSFRVPFLCTRLGIPSVWGPIAGGESVPPNFYSVLGKARWGERLRAWTNRFCLELPSVRQSLNQASRIYVSNRTTLEFLPGRIHPKCEVVPPNTLEGPLTPLMDPRPKCRSDQPFRLLYVGNCVATRALPLVFSAMKMTPPGSVHLKVVGGGPALPEWKKEVTRLGLSQAVEILGPQPKDSLERFYQEADLFVFPALRDSGGSALLEAMARGLPVLCFPWGGPGEMVDTQTGMMIPLDTPSATSKKIAAAVEKLCAHPEIGTAMAQRAREQIQHKFSWAFKASLLAKTYSRLMSQT